MARKIWKIGWRLAVCALLMSWILHAIFQNEGRLGWERQGHSWSQLSRTQQWQAAWSHGTRELWHTLRLVDPIALLLSVLFVGLTILLGVVRWRMVLRVHGIDLALGRTAEISLVAHFFNSFLLGSTGGDLLKAYYAARETHHKKTEAVVTVAVDRLLGLFAMLLFACAMMLPNLALLQAHKRFAALAVFVLLMTIGCGLAIGLSFWGGVSRLWPKSRAWLRNLPKGELLEQCLDACREFGRRRGFILRTLGLSMLLNMVGVFQILALARGLNLNISPVALFAMVPMITCVSALPITPSGLGVRENLYVLMLAAPEIHVPATSALSLSLLAYAGNLFWSLIGSIVYATLKERHHLAEVVQAGAAAGVNGKPPLESPGRKFFKRPIAIDIVRGLQAAGHQAYFVGGCVRDQLLGLEPQDYDIATSAMPEQIESLFPRTVPVGRQFGVVVVIEQGTPFQVATFRAEADYRDGRHPSRVTFCDPRADARRRDFTVNGLFWDPLQNRLHDWVGGEADLRAKIIRTIGDPRERFAEDHLRLLRAVRFAAQLSFGIEPATFAAVRAKAPKILEVSAERIREELLKLFRPPYAARGLDLLRESGLLEQVLPEVAATIPCEQSRDFHPEGTVYNHLIRIFEHLPADAAPSLIWSALLHDIGKPATSSRDPQTGAIHFFGHEAAGAEIANKILQRLRFPRKQTDEIVACVRQHMQFKDVLQMRKSKLRRMLLRPTFPIERELHRLDCLGSHGRLDHYEFLVGQAEQLERQPAIRPPLLTGNDLLGMGMKPGPIMGRLLAELREKQLQDELKTPDEARAWARKQLGEP